MTIRGQAGVKNRWEADSRGRFAGSNRAAHRGFSVRERVSVYPRLGRARLLVIRAAVTLWCVRDSQAAMT